MGCRRVTYQPYRYLRRDQQEVAAIWYLQNQRGWIGDYERWQQQGYSVGSGMMERQVELVIN